MKREPRLERLTAGSRNLRRRLRDLDQDDLMALRDLLERVLEEEVLDREAVRELEQRLLG